MDFVIVGGGANGLVSALQLLQKGANVTVLERGQTGREASWAGGGILSPLCPWDYPDEVTRLALRGMARFAELSAQLHAETGIDPEYEVRGLLVLPPIDIRKAYSWCSTHDMPAQLINTQDVIPESHGECLLLPEIAQVRNPRLLRALQHRVRQLGGKIVEFCQVRSILETGSSVSGIETTLGVFRADHYLLTAGAWCQPLLGKRALPIALKPVRGQMLLYKFDSPPLQHIVLQDGLYLISRRDGHLLIGSTLEDVGFDSRTTDAAREMLQDRARKILPELNNMPLVQHWAGLRPGSPGNIPVIGRHPDMTNLWLNCGHFRYGVTMAPASTEILLNEIQGLAQPFDSTPYHPLHRP